MLQDVNVLFERSLGRRKLCRIAITSRWVDPIYPRARTNSSTVAPC